MTIKTPLNLRLGTRKSLLAMAQSRKVAKMIMQKHPDVRVELVGIETQGDRIQDVPLSKIEGKDFFTAELEKALIEGRIDLAVHSLKDLSLVRPKEICLGAIPVRADPRDIIIFSPSVEGALSQGAKIKIGTSAPRRLENLPLFLKKALPYFGSNPQIEFVEIRGNVNTRLERLNEKSDSPRFVHGVVLALAGLSRLWTDQEAQIVLTSLLKEKKFLILPFAEAPPAPGQGALAVECRSADENIKNILNDIHDPATEAHIQKERAFLKTQGGGCHQRFGCVNFQHPVLKEIFIARGTGFKGEAINQFHSDPTLQPHFAEWKKAVGVLQKEQISMWDGSEQRKTVGKTVPNPQSQELADQKFSRFVFITHARAAESISLAAGTRVWTSGVPSWFKLAQQGIWVEGCSESLGFDFIENLLKEPLLQLPPLEEWSVLTHRDGVKEWSQSIPYATYSAEWPEHEPNEIEKIQKSLLFYWSSASQYEWAKKWISKGAVHACGPGKTWEQLNQQGVRPLLAFRNSEDWKLCLKHNAA